MSLSWRPLLLRCVAIFVITLLLASACITLTRVADNVAYLWLPNIVLFVVLLRSRGMNFDNISILTENIVDIIRAIRYCWVDDSGLICEQQGVFRVNCLDCLDRTNIVQSSIGRIVLEVQVRFVI